MTRYSEIRRRTSDSDIDDAKACAGRELAVWSEFLRDSLKNVNASGPPDVRAVVAESQSTWLKSRELLCSLFDKVDPGMYIGGSDYCRLQEVGRRYLINGKGRGGSVRTLRSEMSSERPKTVLEPAKCSLILARAN
jgi:hypothetical protein